MSEKTDGIWAVITLLRFYFYWATEVWAVIALVYAAFEDMPWKVIVGYGVVAVYAIYKRERIAV